MTLKDQQRMVHVLSVRAVEETELRLAVGRIIGGIDIEQDFPTLPDLSGTGRDKLLAPSVTRAHPNRGRERSFPSG